MGKSYFENRDILIPYDKVDKVAIRDSVAEVHTVSYSKPPVLRNEDAENFLNGFKAWLDGKPIDAPPSRRKAPTAVSAPPPSAPGA